MPDPDDSDDLEDLKAIAQQDQEREQDRQTVKAFWLLVGFVEAGGDAKTQAFARDLARKLKAGLPVSDWGR